MFIIGITGGTGTGKTTALRAVGLLGGGVIDCDEVYHRLLKTEEEMLSAIEAAFPGTVENGELHRKKLGAIVFGDPEKLQRLNAITHPFVDREVRRRLRQAEAEGRPLAVIDAIALLESGLGERCDVTVAILAPPEARIRRLIAREGITEEYARARIAAQHPDEWFRDRCDVTLANNGSMAEFAEKCRQCFLALMKEREA